jgi:hypothetical protein
VKQRLCFCRIVKIATFAPQNKVRNKGCTACNLLAQLLEFIHLLKSGNQYQFARLDAYPGLKK